MTEAGLFSINPETRIARGVLLPWGVKSKGVSASQTAPITFPRGSVAIPRDPIVIGLNDEHERFHVIGRALELEDAEAGIVAAFRIAATDEGDAWITEHGTSAYFSAEIDALQRHPGDIGSGRLAGAAVTRNPAFEGTGVALFSLLGTEEVVEDDPDQDDEDEDTDPAEAEPDDEEPDEAPEQEEDAVADAIAPANMLAGARRRPATPARTREGFIRALFAAHTGANPAALRPYVQFTEQAGLFALADVTYDDATTGLVTDFPGDFLGELWRAVPDVRTFINAVGTSPLRDLKAVGWLLDVPPNAVDIWAGNKADVPSQPITTDLKEYAAIRLAGANDLAREFWDFGRLDVIEAYTRGMVRRYMEKSDAHALAQTIAGATVGTIGAAPVGGSVGLAVIYDLAAQVLAAGGNPNLIRIGSDLYREIGLTLDGNQFAYLGAQVGINGDGDLSGTSFRPDARLAPRQVLVADRNAIGIWELPGSPIRVDAVSLSNGGIDKGFFGYIAAGVVDPAVVLKATAPTPVAAGAAAPSKK